MESEHRAALDESASSVRVRCLLYQSRPFYSSKPSCVPRVRAGLLVFRTLAVALVTNYEPERINVHREQICSVSEKKKSHKTKKHLTPTRVHAKTRNEYGRAST